MARSRTKGRGKRSAGARIWKLAPHHKHILLRVGEFAFLVYLWLCLRGTFADPISPWLAQNTVLLLGWSAMPLVIVLLCVTLVGLTDSAHRAWSLSTHTNVLHRSHLVGILLIWLLLLTVSQLGASGNTDVVVPREGLLASLLARPFLGWPPLLQVTLFGVCVCCIATWTFFSELRLLVRGFSGATLMRRRPAADPARTPSPFLGQRPRYSSYMQASTPSVETEGGEQLVPGGEITHPAIGTRQGTPLLSRITALGKRKPASTVEEMEEHQHRLVLGGDANAAAGVIEVDEDETTLPLTFTGTASTTSANQGPTDWTQQGAAHSPWTLPTIALLLNRPDVVRQQVVAQDTGTLAKIIQDTLTSLRILAEVRPEDISVGPTVLRFGIRPTGIPEMVQEGSAMVPRRDAAGNIVYAQRTRVSRITGAQSDLALALEAESLRMDAPVPGRPYVGIEIPNKNARLVTLREVLESKEFVAARAKAKLAFALGMDVAGAVRVGILSRMPHLLIAGATSSGKSVCLNAIIGSILASCTPEDVRMLMVDPKMVELTIYNGIPHLLTPVVTEAEQVVGLLKIAIREMERRYRLFSSLAVRNLDGYRQARAERLAAGDTTLQNLPAIVIIIDELADLMMAAPEEVESAICRLAQLARATGIHLVIATQRPSVDVITGLIKANIPARISFMVSSAVDSRTIIDMGGAEHLLGRGDMLFLPPEAGKPERIQGAFVADDEAERLADYWRAQAAAAQGTQGTPGQDQVEPGWELDTAGVTDSAPEDELLQAAEQVVQEYERASISLLQRRLRIGYSRAARLIDLLEERGVIGPVTVDGHAREVVASRSGERAETTARESNI